MFENGHVRQPDDRFNPLSRSVLNSVRSGASHSALASKRAARRSRPIDRKASAAASVRMVLVSIRARVALPFLHLLAAFHRELRQIDGDDPPPRLRPVYAPIGLPVWPVIAVCPLIPICSMFMTRNPQAGLLVARPKQLHPPARGAGGHGVVGVGRRRQRGYAPAVARRTQIGSASMTDQPTFHAVALSSGAWLRQSFSAENAVVLPCFSCGFCVLFL